MKVLFNQLINLFANSPTGEDGLFAENTIIDRAQYDELESIFARQIRLMKLDSSEENFRKHVQAEGFTEQLTFANLSILGEFISYCKYIIEAGKKYPLAMLLIQWLDDKSEDLNVRPRLQNGLTSEERKREEDAWEAMCLVKQYDLSRIYLTLISHLLKQEEFASGIVPAFSICYDQTAKMAAFIIWSLQKKCEPYYLLSGKYSSLYAVAIRKPVSFYDVVDRYMQLNSMKTKEERRMVEDIIHFLRLADTWYPHIPNASQEQRLRYKKISLKGKSVTHKWPMYEAKFRLVNFECATNNLVFHYCIFGTALIAEILNQDNFGDSERTELTALLKSDLFKHGQLMELFSLITSDRGLRRFAERLDKPELENLIKENCSVLLVLPFKPELIEDDIALNHYIQQVTTECKDQPLLQLKLFITLNLHSQAKNHLDELGRLILDLSLKTTAELDGDAAISLKGQVYAVYNRLQAAGDNSILKIEYARLKQLFNTQIIAQTGSILTEASFDVIEDTWRYCFKRIKFLAKYDKNSFKFVEFPADAIMLYASIVEMYLKNEACHFNLAATLDVITHSLLSAYVRRHQQAILLALLSTDSAHQAIKKVQEEWGSLKTQLLDSYFIRELAVTYAKNKNVLTRKSFELLVTATENTALNLLEAIIELNKETLSVILDLACVKEKLSLLCDELAEYIAFRFGVDMTLNNFCLILQYWTEVRERLEQLKSLTGFEIVYPTTQHRLESFMIYSLYREALKNTPDKVNGDFMQSIVSSINEFHASNNNQKEYNRKDYEISTIIYAITMIGDSNFIAKLFALLQTHYVYYLDGNSKINTIDILIHAVKYKNIALINYLFDLPENQRPADESVTDLACMNAATETNIDIIKAFCNLKNQGKISQKNIYTMMFAASVNRQYKAVCYLSTQLDNSATSNFLLTYAFTRCGAENDSTRNTRVGKLVFPDNNDEFILTFADFNRLVRHALTEKRWDDAQILWFLAGVRPISPGFNVSAIQAIYPEHLNAAIKSQAWQDALAIFSMVTSEIEVDKNLEFSGVEFSKLIISRTEILQILVAAFMATFAKNHHAIVAKIMLPSCSETPAVDINQISFAVADRQHINNMALLCEFNQSKQIADETETIIAAFKSEPLSRFEFMACLCNHSGVENYRNDLVKSVIDASLEITNYSEGDLNKEIRDILYGKLWQLNKEMILSVIKAKINYFNELLQERVRVLTQTPLTSKSYNAIYAWWLDTCKKIRFLIDIYPQELSFGQFPKESLIFNCYILQAYFAHKNCAFSLAATLDAMTPFGDKANKKECQYYIILQAYNECDHDAFFAKLTAEWETLKDLALHSATISSLVDRYCAIKKMQIINPERYDESIKPTRTFLELCFSSASYSVLDLLQLFEELSGDFSRQIWNDFAAVRIKSADLTNGLKRYVKYKIIFNSACYDVFSLWDELREKLDKIQQKSGLNIQYPTNKNELCALIIQVILKSGLDSAITYERVRDIASLVVHQSVIYPTGRVDGTAQEIKQKKLSIIYAVILLIDDSEIIANLIKVVDIYFQVSLDGNSIINSKNIFQLAAEHNNMALVAYLLNLPREKRPDDSAVLQAAIAASRRDDRFDIMKLLCDLELKDIPRQTMLRSLALNAKFKLNLRALEYLALQLGNSREDKSLVADAFMRCVKNKDIGIKNTRLGELLAIKVGEPLVAHNIVNAIKIVLTEKRFDDAESLWLLCLAHSVMLAAYFADIQEIFFESLHAAIDNQQWRDVVTIFSIANNLKEKKYQPENQVSISSYLVVGRRVLDYSVIFTKSQVIEALRKIREFRPVELYEFAQSWPALIITHHLFRENDNYDSFFVEAIKSESWLDIQWLCNIDHHNSYPNPYIDQVVVNAAKFDKLDLIKRCCNLSASNQPSSAAIKQAITEAVKHNFFAVLSYLLCELNNNCRPHDSDIASAFVVAMNAPGCTILECLKYLTDELKFKYPNLLVALIVITFGNYGNFSVFQKKELISFIHSIFNTSGAEQFKKDLLRGILFSFVMADTPSQLPFMEIANSAICMQYADRGIVMEMFKDAICYNNEWVVRQFFLLSHLKLTADELNQGFLCAVDNAVANADNGVKLGIVILLCQANNPRVSLETIAQAKESKNIWSNLQLKRLLNCIYDIDNEIARLKLSNLNPFLFNANSKIAAIEILRNKILEKADSNCVDHVISFTNNLTTLRESYLRNNTNFVNGEDQNPAEIAAVLSQPRNIISYFFSREDNAESVRVMGFLQNLEQHCLISFKK